MPVQPEIAVGLLKSGERFNDPPTSRNASYPRMGEAALKQRLAAGVREFFTVFLYLAPWFLAFSTYRMFLLKRFVEEPFEYGTGLLNALIWRKVIVTGEYLQLGKHQETSR